MPERPKRKAARRLAGRAAPHLAARLRGGPSDIARECAVPVGYHAAHFDARAAMRADALRQWGGARPSLKRAAGTMRGRRGQRAIFFDRRLGDRDGPGLRYEAHWHRDTQWHVNVAWGTSTHAAAALARAVHWQLLKLRVHFKLHRHWHAGSSYDISHC